jgi:hypothetical protein
MPMHALRKQILSKKIVVSFVEDANSTDNVNSEGRTLSWLEYYFSAECLLGQQAW